MSEKNERNSGRKPEQEPGMERVEKEIDPAQGEIIDAEVSEPREVAGRNKGKGGIGLVIALLALIITVGGLGYGYQLLQGLKGEMAQASSGSRDLRQQQQKLSSSVAALSQRFEQQKAELEAQKAALRQQERKLAEEREKLLAQGRQMEQTLKQVYARVGRSSTTWMASEAAYLMRIANHRLQLEQDVETAIRALEAADQRLRDTGDPGWIAVRKQLADEITALKAVPRLDRVGLSARLSGLSKQVADLKVLGTQPMPPERSAETSDAEKSREHSLETLLKDSWEGFKSVMVIRHRGKPVSAMLPPEQQFFVYQNLRLKLEAARLAILRGDQALFDSSLASAREWLNEFFDGEKSSTRALLKQLDELKGIDLSPELPDISGSLVALSERLKRADQGEPAQ